MATDAWTPRTGAKHGTAIDAWTPRSSTTPRTAGSNSSPSPRSASPGCSNSQQQEELVTATRVLILRDGWEQDSMISDSLNVHAGWVLRVLETKELAGGVGQRVRVRLAPRETNEMERATGEGSITPRDVIPKNARKKVEGWVDAADADGNSNLKPYLLKSTSTSPSVKASSASSARQATPLVAKQPPPLILPDHGGLVTASVGLVLRESWEPTSKICDSLNIHAGWVLRVLETKELAGGVGQRVRVTLARQETDEVERARSEGFISPRSARKSYAGWVDATGRDGPNLKPYEKPVDLSPSSGRSSSRSPRRSPRKKATPEQVHAASGLPLSQGGNRRLGSLSSAVNATKFANLLTRESRESQEYANLEATINPEVAPNDQSGDTAPAKSNTPAKRRGSVTGGALAKGQPALTAAAKKSAGNMWAAFTETLFKGNETEDEAKLRAVFNSIDRDGGGTIDKDELKLALSESGREHTDAQIIAMMRMGDESAYGNGDGEVNFKEFVHIMKVVNAASKLDKFQGKLKSLKGRALKAKGPDPKQEKTAKALGEGQAVQSKNIKLPRKSFVSAEERAAKANHEADEEARGVEEWGKWIGKIGVAQVVLSALQISFKDGEQAAFDAMKSLTHSEVKARLSQSDLGGLTDVLMKGVEGLANQAAPSGAALNHKFKKTGKFMMAYGGLDVFFGGLEALLGPPQVIKDPDAENQIPTIRKAMENEHTTMKDSPLTFSTTNGCESTSLVEWEFAYTAKKEQGEYPERKGLADQPGYWRKPVPAAAFMEEGGLVETQANSRLREGGHSLLILEEVLSGRLYTGPMYMKYNAVLRSKSDEPFLVKQYRDLCHGNNYVSTIHAINSCVIKLSKLTEAGKIWRGVCYGTTPDAFWTPSAEGICGGVEFGFQSMSRDYDQAVHYARGCDRAGPEDATTLFELQMGLVDRGADRTRDGAPTRDWEAGLSSSFGRFPCAHPSRIRARPWEVTWLSQYPHEKEVLLPPLSGLEAIGSSVEGKLLQLNSRLSLNLAAQTLEQVLSRRRKMLMDMSTGIEFELRDTLGDGPLYKVALRILRRALAYGALAQTPEWFNDDDNFSQVLNEVLYLQRILTNEVRRLDAALEKTELNLSGWKARGPARIMLLAGFVFSRVTSADIFIDLRDSELTPTDGEQLARLLHACPKLTALDVRGNESLGEHGSKALIAFMHAQKAARNATAVPRSLFGVGGSGGSTLTIPKHVPPFECLMLCAELEGNVFAEGVSASMGGKAKGGSTLNRRGGHAGDNWQPLIWAAKDGNMSIAEQLLDNGHDINKTEPLADKGGSAWAPLHWSASKGHVKVLEMLIRRGADLTVKDKHGSTARTIAEKKGLKEVVAMLEEAEASSQQATAGDILKRRKSIAPPRLA